MSKLFVLFLFSCCFFTSCSTIRFRSKGSIPLNFSSEAGATKEVAVKGSKEFFLGGFIPYHHDVFIDDEVYKAGHSNLSKVMIDDTNSLKNMAISFVTLGFYCPREYVIKGFTK